jgi:SAM-dependent methyltransferase
MEFSRIRKALTRLRYTPFHPQWHVFRHERRTLTEIANHADGLILDIGCGERRIERLLPKTARYVGLDYLVTATAWYGTKPHIFGDAVRVPVSAACVDNVLLLDVLEHVPDTASCLREAARVLRPHGRLVLQVPFLYPLHDAPLDFHRWTLFGLRELAVRHGFRVVHERSFGHPVETAALLANLALSKLILTALRRRNPMALLAACLPIVVLYNNVFSWVTAFLSPADDFMPHGYCLIFEKAEHDKTGAVTAHANSAD